MHGSFWSVQNNRGHANDLIGRFQTVKELCEGRFYECRKLSCATFGEFSSLTLIGKGSVRASSLREIHIPEVVKELAQYDIPKYTRYIKP